MKKTKKKEKKNTGLIALAIVLVAALIAGGTYAYWVWNSNNLLNIRLNVDLGTMGLNLDGGTATINRLAPAPCTHNTYSTKVTTTVSRYNTTSYPGTVVLTLNLLSLKYQSGRTALTATDLSHLHFLLSTSASSCATAVTGSDSVAVSGTFSGATIGAAGATAGTDASPNSVLKTWEYKLPAKTGTPDAPVVETYYLYVWIDESYTFTNYNTANPNSFTNATTQSTGIQDPMQDLEIVLKWTTDTIYQNET